MGYTVCWVYDTTCTTLPAAHRPPLQWPSATASRHSSRRRHCITQHRFTTATWYAVQLLPAVVLNVALITLLSSCSARLPLSMSPAAFIATCWRQHPWLELCRISIFWRGNYRDMDMPRYDLTIAIFDTIQYILPSLHWAPFTFQQLLSSCLFQWMLSIASVVNC